MREAAMVPVAEHLHDGCSAMLRESDDVPMDMEGSMTPERIAEIFAEETGDDIDASDSALRDFARRMWNEALEEAAKDLDLSANLNWQMKSTGYQYIQQSAQIVRALKLPEDI